MWQKKILPKALADIIKLYKDKGYEFKTINNENTRIPFPLKKKDCFTMI